MKKLVKIVIALTLIVGPAAMSQTALRAGDPPPNCDPLQDPNCKPPQ